MLLPDEYFKTYGEHLSLTGEPKAAWYETEKAFNRMYSDPARNITLCRFTSYESFQAAYRRYNTTGLPSHLEIHIIVVPEIK